FCDLCFMGGNNRIRTYDPPDVLSGCSEPASIQTKSAFLSLPCFSNLLSFSLQIMLTSYPQNPAARPNPSHPTLL
ncbi:MAG TPA: hypothetical protein PKW80_16475, partial [Bacteroidales bacterium]|nr:hypothetical protein [Bacteroidales bacterium]